MQVGGGKRGAVLIIVLGVLAILALLATTFATLQITERQIARNYLDTVRAGLLAMSGVEHAISELRQMSRRGLIPAGGPRPEVYWGDDPDEEGPLKGSPAVKLTDATNPSFAVEEGALPQDPYDADVRPKQVRIDGKSRGFSGVMSSGKYGTNTEMYVLKVTDSSAKIYVNEGITQHRGNASTASRNLQRILNQLGAQSTVSIPNLGDRVLKGRPVSGYQSLSELRSFLSESEFFRAADFLTAHAWVDTQVANPVPYSAAHARSIDALFNNLINPALPPGDTLYYRFRGGAGTPPVYRFGRGKDYLGNPVPGDLEIYPITGSFLPNSLTHGVYAMDELNPQWIEITSRAPVNVNAARKEVLVALLSDLRGVFLSERRRNNIETSTVGGYHYMAVMHSYSPAAMPKATKPDYFVDEVLWNACARAYLVPEGDEVGFLYETYPILGPKSSGSGISAALIAEHVIACREKRTTVGAIPPFDYSVSSLPFSGPFRSWRQFDAFVDNLVAIKVLEDPRSVFYDHRPTGAGAANITGFTPLLASDFERAVASQAIADVLKANFNPNLHLNELNPDQNFHALVDKTDLEINSTEFIFTPTGHYDIESLGRVLQPKDGSLDALTASDNQLVAETRILAGVKLFDLLRETHQSQFAAGTMSPAVSGVCSMATSNGRTVEAGPEPDNGQGPQENRWDGYLAFPTTGGSGLSRPGAGGAPVPTPPGGAALGETIHAHFGGDFTLHHHADGDAYRRDMGSATVAANDKVENYPDRGETVGGPYDPVDNGGNYYRLARSFTLPGTISGSASLPVLTERAPMDLRIDGGYSERHSGLAYWISRASYAPNAAAKQGVLSYWVKPNYSPHRSGKPRLYADMSRRGDSAVAASTAYFTQFWTPGHDSLPGNVSASENPFLWYEQNSPANSGTSNVLKYGLLPFKSEAMIFGVGWGNTMGMGDFLYQEYTWPPSLNHEAHGDGKASLFKGREWTHIVLSWKNPRGDVDIDNMQAATHVPQDYKVFVNGQLPPASYEGLVIYNGPAGKYASESKVDWSRHANGDQNSLRLGSPSLVNGEGPLYNNFSADSTLDEIYFWNGRDAHEATAQSLWSKGRYAFPKTPAEGLFTSQPIALGTAGNRTLAPASTVPAPGGVPVPPSPSTAAAPAVEILGISWTWFAEGLGRSPDGSWVPTLADHQSDPGLTLYPTVEATLPGAMAGVFVSDDGYSAFKTPSGEPPQIPAGSPIQYQLRFGLPGADPLNTILTGTPVVDDVTLYVSTGRDVFTYYYKDVSAR